MSEKKSSKQLDRERPDPSESDRPWPLYVWIILMLMVSWGTTYFALNAGDGGVRGGDQRVFYTEKSDQVSKKKIDGSEPLKVSIEERMKAGKKVYSSVCMACHQNNGQGLSGAFPPLAKSSWVTGKPDRIVKLILHGLVGELEILGQKYNGVMPAHKDQFSDQEIADVVTYIRKSWGNEATEISFELVTKIRDEHKDRTDAWQVEELANE